MKLFYCSVLLVHFSLWAYVLATGSPSERKYLNPGDAGNPCYNGATYSVEKGVCYCARGYSGQWCEVGGSEPKPQPEWEIINPGQPGNPCFNGGTFYRGTCTCVPGYTGEVCCKLEVYSVGPCNYGHETSSGCYCYGDYTGEHCEIPPPYEKEYINPGEPNNPCHNGGTFHVTSSRCTCARAYTGSTCDTPIMEEGCLNTRSNIFVLTGQQQQEQQQRSQDSGASYTISYSCILLLTAAAGLLFLWK